MIPSQEAEEVQVTKTIYTLEPDYYPFEYNLRTSKNRVTAIYYSEDAYNPLNFLYDNAIFYNYDIHGNVKEIAYDNRDVNLVAIKHNIKKVKYDYDLISGNVNEVIYQEGAADEFRHRYTYDADNRITQVETSTDGIVWEADAQYQYYDHGPLARVLLGDQQVQAMDYVYTLQGWLKGVNADEIETNDVLGDGNGLSSEGIAKDAFGYSLNYYTGDYEPISTVSNPFTIAKSSEGTINTKNLYNGNIKTMVTSLLDDNESALATLQNNYTYDQLNRIKSFEAIDVSTNTENYAANYTYDRNGNLENLQRSVGGSLMDDLDYDYNLDAADQKENNRLNYVDDNVPVSYTHLTLPTTSRV